MVISGVESFERSGFDIELRKKRVIVFSLLVLLDMQRKFSAKVLMLELNL